MNPKPRDLQDDEGGVKAQRHLAPQGDSTWARGGQAGARSCAQVTIPSATFGKLVILSDFPPLVYGARPAQDYS